MDHDRQRNKALHESFGVDMGGASNLDNKRRHDESNKPTKFGNDSLIESKF